VKEEATMMLDEVRLLVLVGFVLLVAATAVFIALATGIAALLRQLRARMDARRAVAVRRTIAPGRQTALITPEVDRFVRSRQAAWRLRC
jgi:hypothetical protein